MKLFILLGIVLNSFIAKASFITETDTVEAKKKQPSYHWRLTARLHSKGIFTYGGWVGSDNPTFDVNFTYERKSWGLLVFKGFDLYDHDTFYNFSLISVFKNFKLSKRLTFTPYVGSFLEQSNNFADSGSDLVCILITSYRLNPKMVVEYMGLFGNLVFEPEKDWVSRFRYTYTGKHLDVVSTLWHNNQIFDHSSYWSAGLNIAYSRMHLSEHIMLSFGATGIWMMHSSDPVSNPYKNTIMFTLGVMSLH